MDVHENQQNLISNVSKLRIDEENLTEVTPLTNEETNEEEVIPFMIPEYYAWDTSLLSQVNLFEKVLMLCLFLCFTGMS